MCGIVGYLEKVGSPATTLGGRLLRMLDALAGRGPDSAGVALWGPEGEGLIVRVKLPLEPSAASDGRARSASPRRPGQSPRRHGGIPAGLDQVVRRFGRVRAHAVPGALARLEVVTARPLELAAAIEATGVDVEVVSLGRRLEIVKQVGGPRNLDTEFGLSGMTGTHGLGHTRLSTESRVDLSHSQPFWAHGRPDLAIVHNGHITNYHRLRRLYEQEGVRFYTENDSEIVGVYLARRLADGASLREAMEASVRELDGSFSYLAATADAFGFAKDPFCLKPLLVAETDAAVAVANEEVALQAALTSPYRAREADAGAVAVWPVPASGRGHVRSAARPPRRARPSRRAA